jgi:DNA-binding transcriptional regulator YhcF (GntR family)
MAGARKRAFLLLRDGLALRQSFQTKRLLVLRGLSGTIGERPGVRLWFAHSSEVPIYRQLVTQVVLAILCGDLKPGDRLPSTRELARRFALHPNTVSAGYRQLEREGWTERRRGSGVYVRTNDAPSTPEQILDQHIAGFFRAVRELGLPAASVRARVAEWIAASPPDHFVLIDPDVELRRILLAEIGQITSFPVVGVSIEDGGLPETLTAAIPLCRPSKTKLVRAALPAGVELITLPIRSPNELLSSWLPAPVESMIGVVSHWPEFLETARTMLIAVGLSSEVLVFRDARDPRWRRGLEQATAILCDAFTASQPRMPSKPLIIVSPVLAETAAAELRGYAQPMAL